MKRQIILFTFLLLNTVAFGQNQKAIKDMSIAELNAAKAEATAAQWKNDVAVYDNAIKLKTDIDAALKVEDYDKAASLQEQLKALKVAPKNTEKIKALQADINKAVAAEDFEKADSLKKEVDKLKAQDMGIAAAPAPAPAKPTPAPTPTPTPAPKAAASAPAETAKTPIPAATTPAPSSTPSATPTTLTTSLTKNDIYGTSATWLGVDFSLLTFVSTKKQGQESENLKFIPEWQKLYRQHVPEAKLGRWLTKTSFTPDCSQAEGLYLTTLQSGWISGTRKMLSQNQLQTQVLNYKASGNGVGLVLIPEAFNELTGEIYVYFVWIDMSSKAIIHTQSVSAKTGAGTMASRWLDGLITVTKTYVDTYYKKRN